MHSKSLETIPLLSASGPQSDRGIRIRIAARSPQCPSDELEGAREGEREGRREIKCKGGKGGVRGCPTHTHTHTHTLSVFQLAGGGSLCFYTAAVDCAFKFVLRILAAHTRHTCACTRKYTHRGSRWPAHVRTQDTGNLHTHLHTHTHTVKRLQRHRVSSSERAVQRRVR